MRHAGGDIDNYHHTPHYDRRNGTLVIEAAARKRPEVHGAGIIRPTMMWEWLPRWYGAVTNGRPSAAMTNNDEERLRTMKENSIRRAVREGRAALGTGLKEFASRGVPWIIEASGFDYCMIDHEHGAFDLETIADLAGWFQATDVSAIVRIHKSFTYLIPAILDQGIMGVQVSEVDNADEARAIVRNAKYPPIGDRGLSGQGMHTGYKSHGARHATEYAPWANANVIVCVAIESLEGLENVEAIAAVEGIDMIAYGHSDLSARLGVHLQLEHPTFRAAVRRIAEACKANRKLCRGSAETEAQIEEYWKLGCQVLNLPGTDVSTYLDGLKARAGRAHARLKSIGVKVP